MSAEEKQTQSSEWRTKLKFDRDGRAYLDLEGAALFLEVGPKTLSNRLYETTGPRVIKKNGRLRFYMDDLKAYEKGIISIAHETSWQKIRKSA